MNAHVVFFLENYAICWLPDIEIPDEIGRGMGRQVDYLISKQSPLIPLLRKMDLEPGTHVYVQVRGILPQAPIYGWVILSPLREPKLSQLFRRSRATLPPALGPVYDELVKGKSGEQIAASLGRSRRWVVYRIAEIKKFFEIDDIRHLPIPAKENDLDDFILC